MKIESVDKRAQLRLISGLSIANLGSNDICSAAMNQRLQNGRCIGSGFFGFVEQRVKNGGKNGLKLPRLAEREIWTNPCEDFLPSSWRFESDGEMRKQCVENRRLWDGIVNQPRSECRKST